MGKSSPYEWDMIVIADGEERLLSEFAPIIPCPYCPTTHAIGSFKTHLIAKHGWKQIEGSMNQ